VEGAFRGDPATRPEQIRAAVNAEDLVQGLGSVVLAAGCSRRLGTCKQLLQLGGEPLVRRAARVAVEAGLWPVVVVVGDRAEEVRAALAGLPVVTVGSVGVLQGLSRSIRLGLERLAECSPGACGVVVLACDQPAVGAAHLLALAAARSDRTPVAASSYAGVLGMPALFPAALFPELRALTGEGGCGDLLERHAARVQPVPLPGGELDVDTPEDWARAQRLEG
jgi:molybdenum cofactor cytidylyltransferase